MKKYDRVTTALGMDASDYLRQLKSETGLSDVKLAHDLSADSGVKVFQPDVWKWRQDKGKG